MKLIINADDFALTSGVTKGIIEAIKNGVVSDTTIMVNTKGFEKSVEIAKKNGINEMGLHLNLTCGKPVLSKEEVCDICDKEGDFFRKPEKMPQHINLEQIEKELRAQIQKFKNSGLKLNHMDSHHHSYIFNDDILNIAIKLAKEEGVPLRCPINEKRKILIKSGIKSPDYFEKSFFGDNLTVDHLIERIDFLKDKYETVEFMVHPAIVDEELKNISSYAIERDKEFEILTSTKLKNYLKENNIEVCSYNVLK